MPKTRMIRLIALSFLALAFLAGLTLGHVGLGVINALVFVSLALIGVRLVPERLGDNGLVYTIAGAFFASLLTPYVLFALVGPEPCLADDCPPTQGDAP